MIGQYLVQELGPSTPLFGAAVAAITGGSGIAAGVAIVVSTLTRASSNNNGVACQIKTGPSRLRVWLARKREGRMGSHDHDNQDGRNVADRTFQTVYSRSRMMPGCGIG